MIKLNRNETSSNCIETELSFIDLWTKLEKGIEFIWKITSKNWIKTRLKVNRMDSSQDLIWIERKSESKPLESRKYDENFNRKKKNTWCDCKHQINICKWQKK